jgi:two-component system CheB/CheR fusion protein
VIRIVQAIEEPEALRGLVMIVFTDVETLPETKVSGKAKRTPASSAMLARMEQELQQCREDLQTTHEEMQTSQEELKSANEELQSTPRVHPKETENVQEKNRNKIPGILREHHQHHT